MLKLNNIPPKKLYIICAAVTVTVLLLVLALVIHANLTTAPLYEITVRGLAAETPQDAQAVCRADCEYYRSVIGPHKNCCWVWCGNDKLYIIRYSALKIDPDTDSVTGFTRVNFKDRGGRRLTGHIIDPTAEPVEIARVRITDSEKFSLDNVSMSVRESIRNGIISYENAVYVWEKGRNFVYALKEDAITALEGHVCTFTDDGDELHVGFLLDTRID